MIEKENQVISEENHFFFVNDYGRTELENPPQNGYPAFRWRPPNFRVLTRAFFCDILFTKSNERN